MRQALYLRLSLLALFQASLFSACTNSQPEQQPAAGPAADPRPAPRVTYSWWVTATFEPTEDRIGSIPAHEIDPAWSKVLILTRDLLPPEAEADPSLLVDPKFAFVQEADFNADGIKDRALVGVYKTHSGETGRFLLILTRREGRSWQKAFLEKYPGHPGFTILSYDGARLHWSDCMECDTWADVRWAGTAYEAEWQSCCEDDTL